MEIAEDKDNQHFIALARSALCEVGLELHKGASTVELARSALTLFEEQEEIHWATNARAKRGAALCDRGEYAEGRELLETALKRCIEDGIPAMIAYASFFLGRLELLDGRLERAIERFNSCIDHYTKDEFESMWTTARIYQVWIGLLMGDSQTHRRTPDGDRGR